MHLVQGCPLTSQPGGHVCTWWLEPSLASTQQQYCTTRSTQQQYCTTRSPQERSTEWVVTPVKIAALVLSLVTAVVTLLP